MRSRPSAFEHGAAGAERLLVHGTAAATSRGEKRQVRGGAAPPTLVCWGADPLALDLIWRWGRLLQVYPAGTRRPRSGVGPNPTRRLR